MKSRFRKLVLASALFLFGMMAVAGIFFWHEARLWPFATGTREQAFLGTTFKMSPPEVRRALKRYGGQLTTYEAYRRAQPDPTIERLDFEALFAEDRTTSLYMPAIEMYGAKAEAEFVFKENRLSWVDVYFVPISQTADSLIAKVEGRLREKYKFLDRQESKLVPGAYSLHFASGEVRPSLLVNLTNPKKPIISLTIVGKWSEAKHYPSASLVRACGRRHGGDDQRQRICGRLDGEVRRHAGRAGGARRREHADGGCPARGKCRTRRLARRGAEQSGDRSERRVHQ